MALTDKKRRFIDALRSGLVGAEAARKAGYSAATAAQAASRLMKDPVVKSGVLNGTKVNKGARTTRGTETVKQQAKRYTDPAEFLTDLMNNAAEDIKLRKEAAAALLPYKHKKLGEGGKKDAAADAANKVATGRFAPKAPPKLVVNNR
jgi:phage terminase small subunit